MKKLTAILLFVLLLVAANTAHASNMGFKLNYGASTGPDVDLHTNIILNNLTRSSDQILRVTDNNSPPKSVSVVKWANIANLVPDGSYIATTTSPGHRTVKEITITSDRLTTTVIITENSTDSSEYYQLTYDKDTKTFAIQGYLNSSMIFDWGLSLFE